MDRVTFGGPMDRVLLMRTMPMFEGLGPIQLAAIAQHSVERFVPRESSVEIRGEESGKILLIAEGELESRNSGSRERLAKGDSAGLVERFAHSDARLTFEATSDSMLLELDWDTQLDVCEEHFSVVASYISFVATRLVERNQALVSAEHDPVPLIAAQDFGSLLDLNERLLLLSRSGAFSSGCLDALSELSHHAEELRLKKGRKIWTAGQEADGFVLIASGALRLDDQAGGSAVYRAGTAAGMAESLSRNYRRFSAVTVEPTVALRIQIESFMDILEDHFDLSLDVLATLARRLLATGRPTMAPTSADDAP